MAHTIASVNNKDFEEQKFDSDVLQEAPRCPACGSLQVEVCQLLGHIYPIRKDDKDDRSNRTA